MACRHKWEPRPSFRPEQGFRPLTPHLRVTLGALVALDSGVSVGICLCKTSCAALAPGRALAPAQFARAASPWGKACCTGRATANGSGRNWGRLKASGALVTCISAGWGLLHLGWVASLACGSDALRLWHPYHLSNPNAQVPVLLTFSALVAWGTYAGLDGVFPAGSSGAASQRCRFQL